MRNISDAGGRPPQDFEQAIRALHYRRRLVVEMESTPRGRVRYVATLSGEDFLDGDWSQEASGTARSRKAAMSKVRKALE